MKKLIDRHNLEKGQVIPIVVVSIIALIAFSALILDGGALLLNRRSAQNAADAAALAGAQVLCMEGAYDYSAIDKAVNDYLDFNNATLVGEWEYIPASSSPIANLVLGEVVVTAQVEHGSFFARVFNQDILTAKATAGAGCFPFDPGVVLPIAWMCRAPGPDSTSEDCDMRQLDYEILETIATQNTLEVPVPKSVDRSTSAMKTKMHQVSNAMFASHPQYVTIIMDSDAICGKDINCEFDSGDGVTRYHVFSGSDRGWLNLEGESAGNPNLEGWIKDGLNAGLETHTWLTGIDGNRPVVYRSYLSTRLFDLVWVPVFNVMCQNDPKTDTVCRDAALYEPTGFPFPPGRTDFYYVYGSPATDYYHIVAFAPFLPTCIMASGDNYYSRQNPSVNEPCPGFQFAQDNNPDPNHPHKSLIADNTNTLEGYFLTPDPDMFDGDSLIIGGADLGYYRASLTR